MKASITSALVIVALVATCVFFPRPAQGQSGEELERIRSAMPQKPRFAPAAPRKLLVFTLCRGFPHSAVPYGAKALEIMGEKTGAFSVVVSNDIAMFEPHNLKPFDAVCMDNTTGELFLPPNLAELTEEQQAAARNYDALLKKSLVDFVRSGKGLIGIHAATDCLYQWPEYGEMMGGYFDGHPWNEEIGVKIDDPGHALCQAFNAPTFRVADEIYQFKTPYSRESLRVLLSLDTNSTDMKKGDAIHRPDGDFAVSWIRRFGQGRVFFNSLGHREEIFWNPLLLQYYLDGIQFALGDLPADTTPSAQLLQEDAKKSEAARRSQVLEELLTQIATLEYGQSPTAVNLLEDLVRRTHDDPEAGTAVAARLSEALRSDVSPAAKRLLLIELSLCGTENEVPQLERLLGDPAMSDMALYALGRISGPAADTALCQALSETSGSQKVGVIDALGLRRTRPASGALAKLVYDPDPAVADAALAALGRIGGRQALKTLARAAANATPEREAAVNDAYLCCAQDFLNDGKHRKAARVYRKVYASAKTQRIRVAAFLGLASCKGANSAPLVLDALGGDDLALQDAATTCVRELPGNSVTEAFARRLPGLPAQTQAVLIGLLGDRGDPKALARITAAAKSSDKAVRLAALEALGKIGDAATVPLLAEAAAKADKEEGDTARTGLSMLRGADIDGAILVGMPTGDAPVRVELVRGLAARNAVAAVPQLFEIAKDPDPAVRAESFKALGELAEPDRLPALLKLLVTFEGDADRKGVEDAVVAVTRKVADDERSAAVVLEALTLVNDVPAKGQLLGVLGRIGGETALGAVHKALADTDPAMHDAGLRVLAEWDAPVVLGELMALAEGADNETHRVLALRGALRLLAKENGPRGGGTYKRSCSVPDAFAMYKRAMKIATRDEEKKTVLAGVGALRPSGAAQFVRRYLQNDALKAEAELALKALETTKWAPSGSNNRDNCVERAIDGRMDTRWDTAEPQKPGQWFMVDLGKVVRVNKVTMDAGSDGDCPRGYIIRLSQDGVHWTDVAAGKGAGRLTDVPFAPAKARFVAIEQTGADDFWWWCILEFKVEYK